MIKINGESEAEEIYKIIKQKSLKRGKFSSYYESIICLDTETTSAYTGNKKDIKYGYCYEWSICVDGNCYYQRDLIYLKALFRYLSRKLRLNENKRILVFVHNAGFDFQFFRKYFNFNKTLARKDREIIYATTFDGIEFRCSYALSGFSIDTLGKQFGVPKLKGFQYNLIRHSQTPLSKFELEYCRRDVLIMYKYLKSKAEQEGGISQVELTFTAYMRKYIRESTIYDRRYSRDYRKLMRECSLEVDEYQLLKSAFAGGFTHANAIYSGQLLRNMESYDITSAYPGVMVSEKFPMQKVEIKIKDNSDEIEFIEKIKNFACVAMIYFEDIEKIFEADTYISKHKIPRDLWDFIERIDNGRVDKASQLVTTITDIDFRIIAKVYKWKRFKLLKYQFYRYDYLPKPLIKSVLKLFNDKTLLKGNKEEKERYNRSKGLLNATYGCMVRDVVETENVYDNSKKKWLKPQREDLETAIYDYNNDKKRATCYQWGVWITARCRARIWQLILLRPKQYVYSDTDSGKLLYDVDNIKIINKLNLQQKAKLKKMCKHYNIHFDDCQPKGYLIGAFLLEKVITRFKTLGSKRYITQGYEVFKDDYNNMQISNKLELNLTFSGLNIPKSLKFLKSKYLGFNYIEVDSVKRIRRTKIATHKLNINIDYDKIFNNFERGLEFPADSVGKLEHAYQDNYIECELIDYLGNSMIVKSRSSVFLKPVEYKVKTNDEYDRYISYITAIFGHYKGL